MSSSEIESSLDKLELNSSSPSPSPFSSSPSPSPNQEGGSNFDQSLDRSESSDEDPMTQYSPEEVAKHTIYGDLWIVFQDRVYDVSSFNHPGGLDALIRNSGQDATQRMFETHGHQGKIDRIKMMISQYEIGRIIVPK